MTTSTFKINKVQRELEALQSSYMNHLASDEKKLTAYKYATELLVEELGYKQWLASNLVQLFFTQQVELCETKIEIIQRIHGGNVLEMFSNALAELNYRDTWYKEVHGGRKYTTNQYITL